MDDDPAALVGGANPLLENYQAWIAGGALNRDAPDDAARRWAFSIPTPEAIATIRRHAPRGVVEIGAGRGYWAWQLSRTGVDVVAYDVAPPWTGTSEWFPGPHTFHSVAARDHTAAGIHPDRTLLIVWPTKGAAWPAEALQHFYATGGTTAVCVGQPPGGATGTLWFHALLGEVPRCVACSYGVAAVECTCSITPIWRRIDSISTPSFHDTPDELRVYQREEPNPPIEVSSPAHGVLRRRKRKLLGR